jgi:hypothetical protein
MATAHFHHLQKQEGTTGRSAVATQGPSLMPSISHPSEAGKPPKPQKYFERDTKDTSLFPYSLA